MNLPNKLTMARIILIFPFMFFLRLEINIIALLIFAAASITDYYDGMIARRDNLITDFGKLMDPLADKLLVMSALIMFVDLKYIPGWVVVLMLAREFLVTGARSIAASKGSVIPADKSGKYKTVSQMAAIILILLIGKSPWNIYIIAVPLFFTLWSGYEYMKKFLPFIKEDL